MVFSKKNPLAVMMLLIVVGVLISYQDVENHVYSNPKEVEEIASDNLSTFDTDPTMNFLGKSFDEIKQVLGEPDEEGYSDLLGPHYYILYQQEKGFARFMTPKLDGDKIAASIILGSGQEIIGAKVGMLFSEIKDFLGEPAFGPELGMDNLYYMGYFFGDENHQMPEYFISFSAACKDSPTQDAFIKWEAFEFE